MSDEDKAAQRFWLLQIIRLSGAVMVLLGVMAIAGALPWPQMVGVVLLVGGAVDFFFIPVLLAKHWKQHG
ncbi:hypothetical protein KUV75_08760 [Qipengyuania gaetbuli]|uniref:hypothetical protein n=1 Tax=Qipengyuania gaetbuli TaxID=266952 RepID=UPI001C997210|nr:hypothetical protein [Qipengyuania gaetbuli]MBY6014994.1 hypothetical protein [Qipengyuania gaetbuli]